MIWNICVTNMQKREKNPKEKTTQIMKVANSFSLRCKFFEYVLVCRWMGTASIVVHSLQCGQLERFWTWCYRRWAFSTYKAFFSRFIHISVHMASLIHSLTWPLSLPLLSGEILRGFTLEFLPCAFYPLLTHTHTHTLPHTPQHCPKIL